MSAHGEPLSALIQTAGDQLPPAPAAVAAQGVPGAYSHQACTPLWPQCRPQVYRQFDDVFAAVESGRATVGVLPIENSTEGSVLPVYRLLGQHRLYIVDTTQVAVEHCLLGLPGAALDAVGEVYSHPQALGQCRRFFEEHPHLRPHESSNTAAAAEMVAAAGDQSIAAIASEVCAELYGLSVLRRGVQDQGRNRTRFIAVMAQPVIAPTADRVSVCAVLPHVQGSLFRFLAQFESQGLNLQKIESRPIPDRDFEFLFYLDFSGNLRQPGLADFLDQLQKSCEYLQFLGNYPDRGRPL